MKKLKIFESLSNPQMVFDEAKSELKKITDYLDNKSDFVRTDKKGGNVVQDNIVRAMSSYEYKGYNVIIDVYKKNDEDKFTYSLSVTTSNGQKYLHEPKFNSIPDTDTFNKYIDELTTTLN